MFRLLILRKMKPRPAADGLGPGPRSGRAAGDGGADFVGGGVERSAAETAAKLGEPSILDAARSPPDAGPVSGFPPSRMAPSDRSEEHTSELQSLMRISYAVFCLKKKKNN